MIWTLIAHVTTFLNLAKQQAEIPVVTIYGQSPSLVRHKSCGTPRSAHGYALIMPVCVTEPLYQQRQLREESNEKEVRVRARLSILGSTVDLISRSSLHTTGFLLGLFWTMSNLGKDCEAIIYIYIFIYLAVCPGPGRHHWSSWAKLGKIQPHRHLKTPSWGLSQRAKTVPCGHIFFQDSQKAVSIHVLEQWQATALLQVWKSWFLLLFVLLALQEQQNSTRALLLLEHGAKVERWGENFGPYF